MDETALPSFLQLVNCGYCAKSMRRKNLKGHTTRCHQGQPLMSVEGEALKRLLEEIRIQQEKEKEKKALNRLTVANEKRMERERAKAIEKEQEIQRQKVIEAQRKEQEEARKKKKRELLRKEKQEMKRNNATKDILKPSTDTVPSTDAGNSTLVSSEPEKEATNNRIKKLGEDSQCKTGGHPTGGNQHRNESQLLARLKSTDSDVRTSLSEICHAHSVVAECSPGGAVDTDSGFSKSSADSSGVVTAQSSSKSSRPSDNDDQHAFINQRKSFRMSELETRQHFKDAKSMEDILNRCPNFDYDKNMGAIKCVQCSSSSYNKPIHYLIKPDDSKSLQLAKFRDTKKKLLDHLYKTSMHKRSATSSSPHAVDDINVQCGTRVIRAIYGKIKTGGGYKSIEQSISERAADDLDMGNINHGRHFASSMTTPIYEAVKRRVQRSIKRTMPGFGRPPPFCLIADKMTPARTTLQIVGVISPSQETGKLQSICLGVKECLDGTGLGTSEEMVNCLKEYYSSEEIKNSLVGVAVDGAYHHHNIKDHLPSILEFSSDQQEIFATSWDAAHLIELSAQKSRGQTSKDKAISTPWIKSTFDTVTSVKTFAGRGKNWKDLQENTALVAATRLNEEAGILQKYTNKPLKKFQSFSNTRFARFSQRVLGNMRENFKATCNYLETKSKEGCGLLNKLARPDFVLRLSGLDDIYDHIGRASERLQSCRLYGWNTLEILEETTSSLGEIAGSLRRGQLHPKMNQFNLAVEEVSAKSTYQGVPLQGQSSGLNTEDAVANIRQDLAQHIDNFNVDLQRRTQEQTPRICKLSREAFSLQRVTNRPADFVPNEFDKITDLMSSAGVCDENLTREDWHREYINFTRAVNNKKSALETERNCGPVARRPATVGVEEVIYSNFFSNRDSSENFKNVSYLLCRAALQSSCEAVTEGMGSVVKNTIEGRENMAIEKLSQEVFIRLNGPQSNKNCNGILREAGDIRFGDRTKWHFVASDKAKYKGVSKILSRLNNEEERFDF